MPDAAADPAKATSQIIGTSRPTVYAFQVLMAEKVKKLGLERDYKKFLYFIDGDGNISRKSKSGEGESEVLVPHAVQRDNQFLYFIDKEGDVARSPRAARKKRAA
jgi:hypothetical protein